MSIGKTVMKVGEKYRYSFSYTKYGYYPITCMAILDKMAFCSYNSNMEVEVFNSNTGRHHKVPFIELISEEGEKT